MECIVAVQYFQYLYIWAGVWFSAIVGQNSTNPASVFQSGQTIVTIKSLCNSETLTLVTNTSTEFSLSWLSHP